MKMNKKEFVLPFIIIICGIIMPFVLYCDLFLSNKLFVSSDGIAYLPFVIFAKNALLNGEIPFWNPYLNNGIPFISDVSMGPFYLPALILGFLPLKFFVYTVYGVHVALAGFFSFKFFRSLGCSNKIAFLTAILYMFSINHGGFRKEHLSVIFAATYIPAVMYAIESYFLTKNKKYLCLCSCFLGLQFFSPFIQLSAYTFGTALIYFFLKSYYKKNGFLNSLKSWTFVTISYLGLIAIQLLPTLEMLTTYKKDGTIPPTLEYFKAYSISLNKLIMMVFPKWFNGNIFEPGGGFKSSGLDIELFCGVCVFAIFTFAIVKYFKNKQIKIFSIMIALTIIYAAHGNIPYLSNLFFLIPGINGFRCPARVLFITLFFVYSIFAYGLNLCIQKKDFLPLLKYVCTLASIMIISSLLQSFNIGDEDVLNNVQIWINLFRTQIIGVLVLAITLYFLKSRNNVMMVNGFIIMIAVITLTETIPYYIMNNSIDINKIVLSSKDVSIKSNLHYDKIWDAFEGMNASHVSIISKNKAMSKEIPAINAYIPFNIPNMYRMFSDGSITSYNSSGLTTGSLYAKKNVHMQNPMLSMLGIKYLIDSSNIIKEGNYIDKIDENKSVNLINNSNFLIKKNKYTTVESIPVPLVSDTLYRIEFDYDINEYAQIFNIDLFGGNTYDYPETQANTYQGIGKHHVVRYINSGNVPVGINTYIRIITYNSPQVLISNFKVDKCYINRINNFYQFYQNVNGQDIYLNPEYKDILYTVPSLVGNINKEKLYGDIWKYNFLKESYLEDEIPCIQGNQATIKIIKKTNNTIRALVASEKESFVNFSQNYYPGWHAYVNGKDTKIYLVNGVIQGVVLPKGNNILEFKYEPTYLNSALIISFVSLSIMIIIMWKNRSQRL